MKVLFVSKDLLAGNLAVLLRKEGHEVKLYIEDGSRRKNLQGLVNQTEDWEKDLEWVGKDGLIVFDDVGFGKTQDALRKKGYRVFGGSYTGERMETNRYFGHEIFRHNGIQTFPLLDFDGIDTAIKFLEEHGGKWVLKQNNSDKEFTYVGYLEDASDTIAVLKNYDNRTKYKHHIVTLHKRIEGVEVGVARYFNGHDWVGPIEMNLEHKHLFPGDIGPMTFEMGTLAWYDDDEDNKLFQETLAKLKDFLIKADFRGDFSINCIVNEKGAFPTEATARLGCPIIHLQTELHDSSWGDFLYAVASGESYDLKWKKGFGLVATVALPPFPFHFEGHPVSSNGIPIHLGAYAKEQIEHIHLDEVSVTEEGKDEYFVSGDAGYGLYVTAVGKTVREAQKKLYKIIEDIHVPRMFYRNDIGNRYLKSDEKKLKEWGYIKETFMEHYLPFLMMDWHFSEKTEEKENSAR